MSLAQLGVGHRAIILPRSAGYDSVTDTLPAPSPGHVTIEFEFYELILVRGSSISPRLCVPTVQFHQPDVGFLHRGALHFDFDCVQMHLIPPRSALRLCPPL